MNEILKINGLKTYFYTEKGVIKAVDGVDFSMNEGDTLGIVGESGCGKTVTALSVLQLVPEPGKIVGGSILFNGMDLATLDEAEINKVRGNKISMIFQESMASLNPVLRVGDQVTEAIELHQGLSKKEATEKAIDMFKLVRLPSPETRLRNYPHQMSGGMLQRVMIAMALSCNPILMIADEPTTALDVTIQAQILALINRLKEEIGMSVVLITHDLGVVAETAQYVAVMYAGKVVEYTNVVDLFKKPMHPYTRGLLNSIPMTEPGSEQKESLSGIPGTVPSLLELPDGCKFQDRCDYHSDKCSKEEPELKELEAGHLVRCWEYIAS